MTASARGDGRPGLRGALFGLAAAASFGLSAPLAKVLLGSLSPVLLAGLLYLGAAEGLWLHRLLAPSSTEAPLVRGSSRSSSSQAASQGRC
jgi:hypothetical protein